MQIKKLYSQIEKHDVISFDIFDTLLLRPFMKPQDVFTLLEQTCGTPGFAQLRSRAEEQAFARLGRATVTFDEIYSVLPRRFTPLQQKEWELEERTLYPNPEMRQVYEYALQKGKRIILTSDMYLPSALLSQVLNKHGFHGYENLFISAEQKAAKHNGTLFAQITQHLNLQPKQILHIGDNLYSDGQRAREAGWDSYCIHRAEEKFFKNYPQIASFWKENQDSLTASIVTALLLKKYLTSPEEWRDYWYYFGYVWGGPLCYGLTRFVLKRILEEKIKEVIFVARDGYTIEKIFELMAPQDIRHYYIYASRSINLVCSLDYSGELPWTDKAGSILRMAADFIPQLRSVCNNLPQDKEEKALLLQKYLPLIKPTAEKIVAAYRHYFSRFVFKDSKIALFDISGGAFNSYKLLSRSLGPDKRLLGLYWLISAPDTSAFWCKAYQTGCTDYVHNYEILELIVTAPELPVRYIDEGGHPVRLYNPRERLRAEIYARISPAEVDFSRDVLKIFGPFSPDFECNPLIRFINILTDLPGRRDYKNFKSLQHGMSEDHKVYRSLLQGTYRPEWKRRLKRWRYALLRYCTWGKKRMHYKQKLQEYKGKL